jgi:phosphopantetheinyl transferase
MSEKTTVSYQDLLTSTHRPSLLGRLAVRASFVALIDLWLVKVAPDGPLGLDAARDLLEQPSAMGQSEDGDRSLVAQAALRRLVAARAHLDADAVTIGHDDRGRPVVLGGSALQASISHSGDFVACALAQRRVGVDIERIDRAEADDALATRVCSADERHLLAQTEPGARRRALIRLWTRKEALSKALGVGLGMPFERLDVNRDIPVIDGVRATGLRVRDIENCLEGYAVAIACEARRGRLRAYLIADETASRI